MTIEELIEKCKCGIYLTINKHRDYYQTEEEAIKEINEGEHQNYKPLIDDELSKRMIEEKSIVELQFYPETPIGSYSVYGTSIKEVLEIAENVFN